MLLWGAIAHEWMTVGINMEIRSAVCYSLSLPDQEPMAYIRLVAPFRQTRIRLISGIQNGEIVSDLVHEGDVVIVQREFPKQFGAYQKVVETARQAGKPLIFEIDDLLFFFPEEHPDRLECSFASALLPMLQALLEADLVIVSTPALRSVLVEYNENVIVLPNYLDDSLWSLRPPTLKDSSHGALTIGYMGTYSHKPDLEYVAPALMRLIEQYPQRVRFHIWGPQPPASLRSLPQVEWTPFISRSYEKFAAYFQAQSVDIFIAPLVDNLFNRCKSPLKFLEYSALGTPGVYSRIEPYERVVEHGRNGLLASTLEEWEKCLTRLIDDDELRFRLATQAQATVAEKWLLSQNASRWLETLQTAVNVRRDRKNTAILHMLASINSQLSEVFQALTAQIEEQMQMIRQRDQDLQTLTALEEQKRAIQLLEAEILGYVLSRSWRMTRPFRKISRKIKAWSKVQC